MIVVGGLTKFHVQCETPELTAQAIDRLYHHLQRTGANAQISGATEPGILWASLDNYQDVPIEIIDYKCAVGFATEAGGVSELRPHQYDLVSEARQTEIKAALKAKFGEYMAKYPVVHFNKLVFPFNQANEAREEIRKLAGKSGKFRPAMALWCIPNIYKVAGCVTSDEEEFVDLIDDVLNPLGMDGYGQFCECWVISDQAEADAIGGFSGEDMCLIIDFDTKIQL